MFKTLHNLHYEQIGKEVRCIEDELPFEIPDSWEWVRFNTLCHTLTCGYASTPEYVDKDKGKPFISAKNIKPFKFMPEDYKCIKTDLFCKLREGCCPQRGDILLTRVGAGIGEAAIIDTDLEFAIYVSLTLIKLISNKDISNEYILYWLNSPVGIKNSADNTAGKGASQGNLNVKNVRYYYVAVPPIEEQKRIVSKLKELEPLIEKYNQAETKLYKLNSNIKEQLKKSILQYAIEGKLVPQDSNDEPASVLLERIRKKKEKLIAEGKIKKDKNESMIYRRDNSYYEKLGDIETCINDKLPYDLPASWSWCNVGNLFTNSTGLSYKKDQLNKKSNSMVRVLRGGNILEGNYILNSDDVFISSEFVNDNLYLKKGYMITPAVTSLEHIGKIALIDKDYDNIVVGGFVLMLKPVFKCHILIEYLLLFFSTNYYREECRKITHKSGQAFYNLSRDKLMKLYIVLNTNLFTNNLFKLIKIN